jgi:predicted amino acid racemase
MLDGGVSSIGDSRVYNIKKLKESGLKTEFMLLRTPMISEIEEVVEFADISLNSEIKVIKNLSKEAIKKGKIHNIILMVEMGDLREGANIEELNLMISNILNYQGLNLYGIGMNLACFGGVVPTKEKIVKFEEIITNIEKKFDLKFKIISGGNSANIPLLIKNVRCKKITNLRIGEGILIGLETVNRTPITGTFQDAFILEAEIIEKKEKPSIPEGKISQNAFGKVPEFEDRGDITRCIVAIGKQDVIVEDLIPIDKNIDILGSSSDHIIIYDKNPTDKYQVGDTIKFTMKYGALVHLFTSKYVKKEYIN